MVKKIPLDKIKQGLLNRFENDLYSLTVAAYLQAQKHKLSKREQDEFVLSVLQDARIRYSQSIVDLGNKLIF
jgi:hypothetical protein